MGWGYIFVSARGSTRNVMKGRIFDLAQIRRAAELGIGV